MDRIISDDGDCRLRPGAPGLGDGEHPLGPRLIPRRIKPAHARLVSAGLVLGGAALFAVAGSVDPPPAGFGAHEQLGLGPCSVPLIFGIPCPTCGMTTSFAHFVRGDLQSSFHTQPAGFAIALCVFAVMVAGVAGLLTGRMWSINWYRVRPGLAAAIVVGVLLLGWAYKLAGVLLSRGL